MHHKYKVLSTGSINRELISESYHSGIEIDIKPFTRIFFMNDRSLATSLKNLENQCIEAIFTSANAVNAIVHILGKFPTKWHIYCIGQETSRLILTMTNEKQLVLTAMNAETLANKISKGSQPGSYYFFCGDKRLDTLPDTLTKAGNTVNEVEVYKNVSMPQEITEPYDGVLFYSPSAVSSYFSKNAAVNETAIFTIGSTTTDAVKQFTDQPVRQSRIPSKKNMIMEAIAYFSAKN